MKRRQTEKRAGKTVGKQRGIPEKIVINWQGVNEQRIYCPGKENASEIAKKEKRGENERKGGKQEETGVRERK